MIRHYYHLYADGQWEVPLKEHIRAWADAGVDMHITVCMVGNHQNLQAAQHAVAGWADRTAVFDHGYEQRTINIIQTDLRSGGFGYDPVLYAHTKGAGQPIEGVSDPWRRCMTERLVKGARDCLALLEDHETVGCHWLTPEEHPDCVEIPYYGGNFWWATAAHLHRLPPVSYETRYHAEAWLGSVRPNNPANLVPGWPGAGCASH